MPGGVEENLLQLCRRFGCSPRLRASVVSICFSRSLRSWRSPDLPPLPPFLCVSRFWSPAQRY